VRRPALLLLALALLGAVRAEDEALRKEQLRIERRQELRGKFGAQENLVVDKIEGFALEPIRDWSRWTKAVLEEPKPALALPLRYYLIDEDWEVVAFACGIVGLADLPELLPEMTEAYDAASYGIVRRHAMRAAQELVGRKRPEARALLEKGLRDGEPAVRFIAVNGLEALGDDEAKKALLSRVDDPDLDTRYRARAALASLGAAEVQARLLSDFAAFAGSKDLQRRASLVLEDVGERYSQFLNALALGEWGSLEAIRLLGRALLRQGDYKNKLFLSVGSAAALGRARPREKEAAEEQARLLRAALSEGDAPIRELGALAAGQTRDPQYLKPLQRLLADAQSDVRHNAAEALGLIRDAAAAAALSEVVANEKDVPVRVAAVRALSRQEGAAAIDGLTRALRDKRYMVRAAGARMLGRRGSSASPAVAALAKAAGDPDYGVREAAVVALGRIGDPAGIDALTDALRDRDRGVRIRALRALARFPDAARVKERKPAVERAAALLLDADESLQRGAARDFLLRVRSPHAVPPLLEALGHDTFARREAAFFVLRDFAGAKTLGYSSKAQGAERDKGVKAWREWWAAGGPIVPPEPPPTRRASQDLPVFHRYTRDLRWRGIDLALLYDSTGSMTPVIRAVKQRVDLLLEETARIVPNVRMSLFTYRDVGEEYVYYGTPLTYATENLKAFAQVAEANRGGDLPEAVTETVKAAVEKLQWLKDAQKVVVVIGDAPYHPESSGELFSVVRKFAKPDNKGVVHAIFTDPNRLGESINARKERLPGNVTLPFLERFAEMTKAGNGRAITIEDTESLITEILVLSFGEQWRAELESRLDFE